MKIIHLMAITAALTVSVSALAAENGEALFKKSGCTACHKVDGKNVGPSMKAVAEKYKGDAGAQAKLETKIRNGGSGSFGTMPMPPVSKSVSNETIKDIAAWALQVK